MPKRWFPEPVLTVLLVCTGNICRSAMAERLGRAYLDDVLGPEASAVRLVSAGTRAVVDSTMHPHSALVLQGFGGEPGNFRARQVTADMANSADLILTMTRAHRGEVLEVAPRALSRTYSLREAAAILDLTDERIDLPLGAPAERGRALVQALAAGRSRRRSGADDDVPDPIGLPLEVHQEVGEVIAATLLPLLHRLVGPRPPASSGQEGRQ